MTHSDLGPELEADNLGSRLDTGVVGADGALTGSQYFLYLTGLLSSLAVALVSFAPHRGRASE